MRYSSPKSTDASGYEDIVRILSLRLCLYLYYGNKSKSLILNISTKKDDDNQNSCIIFLCAYKFVFIFVCCLLPIAGKRSGYWQIGFCRKSLRSRSVTALEGNGSKCCQ